MRKKLVNTLLAVAAATLTLTPALLAADATPVHNEMFDVTLPAGFGEFTTQTQKAQGEEGTIETRNWISKAPTGEAIVVTVSTMPGKILDPSKMLESTRDSLLKSLNATLENENQLSETSRDLLFRSQQAAFLRSRLDVRENQLFQLLYVGRSEEQRELPSVGKLFESFQIAAVATPAAPAEAAPATTASSQ